MNPGTPRTLTLAATALLATTLAAQDLTTTFAEPVRLEAGGKLLGAGRLYPSPVYRDMNGDGHLDIVVGDLRGLLTYALREPGTDEFRAEAKVMDLDGRDLDFNNW